MAEFLASPSMSHPPAKAMRAIPETDEAELSAADAFKIYAAEKLIEANANMEKSCLNNGSGPGSRRDSAKSLKNSKRLSRSALDLLGLGWLRRKESDGGITVSPPVLISSTSTVNLRELPVSKN